MDSQLPRDPTARHLPSSRFDTLPERVDGNRNRRLAFLVSYVTLSSALVAAAVVAGVYLTSLLIALRVRDPAIFEGVAGFGLELPFIFAGVWALSAPAFAVWCVRALRRPETALLGQLGAVPVGLGAQREAKSVLHDASIAGGIPIPRLAVITDDSLNAFVIARSTSVAWVGVTTGLLGALSPDELRCVFAHLVARVVDGSALTATLLAELFDASSRAARTGDGLLEAYAPDEWDGFGSTLLKELLSPATLLYGMVRMCLGLTTLVVVPGYKRTQMLAAECADSEGMLLARDPDGMLGALEKVLPADNRPGRVSDPRLREDIFGALFFAWPTFSFADDPELVRISRLREVLRAAGVNTPGFARQGAAQQADQAESCAVDVRR
jgi:Zn-dependent protease with chaperone function